VSASVSDPPARSDLAVAAEVVPALLIAGIAGRAPAEGGAGPV
jgi:hypothetical protein